MEIASRICTAFSAAAANASEITVGWMPRSSRSRHFFSSAPQITVTDVVPSPATTSCVIHRILVAAGVYAKALQLWCRCHCASCLGKNQACLRLRQLHEHLGRRLQHRHLIQDGCTVVGDDHLPIGLAHLHGLHEQHAIKQVTKLLCLRTNTVAAITILSMPRGPRLVRIASATALAASIFVVRTSFFLAFSLHRRVMFGI